MATASKEQASVKLTCAITRKYGSIEATFGAEIIVADGSPNTMRSGYALLEDIVAEQFDHYEKTGLPQTNMPNVGKPYDNPKAGTEIEDATFFQINQTNGKRTFKFFTVRYSKWGVNVYSEVLGDILPLDSMEVGKKYKADIFRLKIDVNGKAPKVVAIERK